MVMPLDCVGLLTRIISSHLLLRAISLRMLDVSVIKNAPALPLVQVLFSNHMENA